MNQDIENGTTVSGCRTRVAMRRMVVLGALLVSMALTGCSGIQQSGGSIDYSRYDQPLYSQVVGRIQQKVSARLGTGRSFKDRYFIIPFAYQNRGNKPESSHSFITVIRVFADGSGERTAADFKTGTYKHKRFEAFTISWIPHDFLENPHLCVFCGIGARLIPKLNQCRVSVGKNFNLEDTLKMAENGHVAVGMWGPYEISKQAFDLGVKRKELLDSGVLKYRADDRLTRPKREAINCFHAMASLEEFFPAGGIFGTGFKMWGLNGTKQVLREYSTRESNKESLLEPVDLEKDLYGFVYVPTKDPEQVYAPFRKASAYRKR